MARSKKKLDNAEVLQICESELWAALGSQGNEISEQRARAIDYYVGDMNEYLSVEDDRSRTVSRDVSDTVEWILPSLMRIFVDAENACVFVPQGPEDEDQADTESNVVEHIFYRQNPGFLNLYSFVKDALLQKIGAFKCWWDEPEWEREEYIGLTQEQVLMMLNEPGFQYEILKQEQRLDDQTGMPLVDLEMKVATKAGKVKVSVIPPEEFGISPEANSPDPKEAPFLFHRRKMTAAELIEDGYDEDMVRELPFEEDIETSEELAKASVSGWRDYSASTHWSMRSVWITECYLNLDRNGDGIAELLKVTIATGNTNYGSSKMLDDPEEVDSSYISAACPVPMTHKFFGQSIADLVIEIQDVRTSLLRGILDNTYLANNGRTAVNERVNLDDLLGSRPGGVVRTEGDTPPGQHLMPFAHTPLPPEAFATMELMEQQLKQRTGVGDEVMGLDANTLANVNTGAMMQAYDAARMRIELIARILAELGVKECFRDVHELARKHQDIPMQIKLDNEWVQVNPSEWRERDDMEVQVGIGNYTRERMMMSLADIKALQAEIFQLGGMGRYMTEENVYNMLSDQVKYRGLEPTKYFTDPQTLPPPQEVPDPAEIAMQLEQQKMQLEQRKLEVEVQKMQVDAQIKTQESQARLGEQQMKGEIENLKAQIGYRKMEVDEQSQILNAESNAASATWKAQYDEMSLLLDKYKAELSSATTLEAKLMEIDQRQSEQMARLFVELEEFRESVNRDGMDRIERVEERESARGLLDGGSA